MEASEFAPDAPDESTYRRELVGAANHIFVATAIVPQYIDSTFSPMCEWTTSGSYDVPTALFGHSTKTYP
jgi:hypothetical protein